MYIVAYTRGTGTLVVGLTRGITKINQLILQQRDIAIEIVREVLDAVFPAKFKLKTPVLHLTEVTHWRALSDIGRYRHVGQHILGLLLEVIKAEAQTVAEEAHIHTEVDLLRGLPLDVGVSHTTRRRAIDHRTIVGLRSRIEAASEVIVLTTVHE